MQKRIINVLLTGQLPRAYVVIKVLKETDNMIRFIGTDQNGEVALVIAQKTPDGRYKANINFDIPLFGIDENDNQEVIE